MPVTVQIGGLTAEVRGGVWSSANRALRRLVTAMYAPEAIGAGEPDRDLAAAVEIAGRLKGRVIAFEGEPVDAERVY